MKPTMIARSVRLVGAVGAEIRFASYQGVEHLVVPVVAMVGNSIVWPINAPAPEFVPVEALAVAPANWNGRPVLPDHPVIDGHRVSANDPRILESQCFGQTFNAHMDGLSLAMEAWLNPSRAKAVGRDAERVIERARTKDLIEISIGAFIVAEAAEGQQYAAIWREILSDHLAMLPEGAIGACSNEMGCGAPRVARAHRVTARGLELVPDSKEPQMSKPASSTAAAASGAAASAKPAKPAPPRSLRERLFSQIASVFRGAEEGVSDVELRGTLNDALRAVEPGFLWIEEVFPTDARVIYAVQPEDTLQLFRRTYSLADDGTVTLVTEREQVQRVTNYEPVTAASAAGAPTAACGCGGTKKTAASAPAEGGRVIMNEQKAARVKALIACPKTPYKDADTAYLEGLEDARLAELEAHFGALPLEVKDGKVVAKVETAASATPPAPSTGAAAAAQAPKPPTTEEFLAAHPDIASIVAEHKAAAAAKKTALVAQLKDAQDGYTEAELQALPLETLERLAKVAKVAAPTPPDYAGVGVPRQAAAEDEAAPVPPDLGAALKAARSAQ